MIIYSDLSPSLSVTMRVAPSQPTVPPMASMTQRIGSNVRSLRITGTVPSLSIAETSPLTLRKGADVKAKEGFLLRELMGEYVLVPRGSRVREFRDAVLMNDLSAFLWERLQRETTPGELLAAVLEEYDVDEERAAGDLSAALEKMTALGILEE